MWVRVQALTIAGEKMSKTEKIAKSLDQVVKKLGVWSNDPNLEARIRFKIKDLQARPDPPPLRLLSPCGQMTCRARTLDHEAPWARDA